MSLEGQFIEIYTNEDTRFRILFENGQKYKIGDMLKVNIK